MVSKKILKKKIFEYGVKAIYRATGSQADVYFCPICGNTFVEENLNNKLTLEHIPPKAQGGKGMALTCKNCNNTAGRTVDIAVTTRNYLEGMSALFTKEGPFNTRVRVDFGQDDLNAVNYELLVKDGAVRFYPVEGANRPDYATNMTEFIKKINRTPDEERNTWKMTTRKRFNPWHAKVGDLRSAFLVCFAMFGYNFAFDTELEPVRNQIKNYDQRIIDCFFISLNPDIETNFTLGIVTSPFSALFCQLQNYGIFLPWIGSPKDFYKYLENIGKNDNNLKFTFTPIPWPKKFEAKLDFMQ